MEQLPIEMYRILVELLFIMVSDIEELNLSEKA
jgi:hypothetical protein